VGAHSRQEIEQAFARYQEVAAACASSGDWSAWSELFTEDATYVEHFFGRFQGRRQIHDWISSTMSAYPNRLMAPFPVQWHVVDEDRGWVVCCVANVMEDPGDGGDYRAVNWTLLKYAGGGQWHYEEDIYNPGEFQAMVQAWAEARERSGRPAGQA